MNNDKEIIIREFLTPTDIYICGCDFRDITESFAITDDEATLRIRQGEDTRRIDTSGYVFIFTAEELLAVKDTMDDFGEIFYIENYEGKLILTADVEAGDWRFTDFKATTYIHDCIETDLDVYYDVVLNLEDSWRGYIHGSIIKATAIQNLIKNV
jgi:hypothetical protein